MMALGGLLQLCVSGSVYAEYEEVISRPRFKRSPEIIAGALQAIRENALWVRPTEKLRVCLDPDDDAFLECAQAAHACPARLRGFASSAVAALKASSRGFLCVLCVFA
jgi:uncharacterized protein